MTRRRRKKILTSVIKPWVFGIQLAGTVKRDADPVALEFHHLGGKDKAVRQMAADGSSIDRIKKEIEKTEVLCSNCHRRKTARDQGWFRK